MDLSPAVLALVSGLALGLTLIVAIGAQNAFVLRQGLLGRHVGLVVAGCAVSDLLLIAAGVAGAGALVTRAPALLTAFRVVGGLFLLGYAVLAAHRALRPGTLGDAAAPASAGALATLATCLALTWLNPHVYLDTVVLLGSVASTRAPESWWFGAGAGVASVAWFSALGFGARFLRPVFARPVAWRVLDAVIGVVMLALGAGLLLSAT